MSSLIFCGICLEKPVNFDDCVVFKSTMKKTENLSEDLTYLDCFELVTHLKIDINIVEELSLCSICRCELENSFNFLRKAEKSQRLLYEKIESEQRATPKQDEINQDVDLNDLIEEIVSDDNTAVPVLTDAMLGTNSMDCFEALSESAPFQNDIENNIESVPLSPLSQNEANFGLQDVIISTEEEISLRTSDDDDKQIHSEASGTEHFSCNSCPKTFKTEVSLKTHLKYHKRKNLSIQSDACQICEKTFATTSYLRQHMELVHMDAGKRQQFQCNECKKVYFTKNALRNHKRFHKGETIECDDCQKSFVTRYDLKIHQRFHRRDYPFVCNICEKKFAIKGHLSTHMREHQGLKLQCEDCGKLFTSTKALLDHSFVHTGEMPYPCSYCKKSYPSKQKYKEHLSSAHKSEFDEFEHTIKNFKSLPRRKNLTLVQADSIIKEIEIQTKNETENFQETQCSFDDIILEVS